MIENQLFRNDTTRYWLLVLISVLACSLFWGIQVARAQSEDASEPKVQILSGLLGPDTIAVYRLLNLEEGQHLYVRMENTAGNLDPFVMLFAGDIETQAIIDQFTREIDRVIAEGGDPLVSLPDIFDDISLA